MEIRLAQREDIPGMIRLLLQVGQVHHMGRPDIFRSGAQKYNETQLETMLNHPENPIFVARDAAVLGYGFCFLQKYENDPVLADRQVLYLDDLCVEESCRGQGIATALFQRVHQDQVQNDVQGDANQRNFERCPHFLTGVKRR